LPFTCWGTKVEAEGLAEVCYGRTRFQA
jgi:hypothetical protein